MSEQEFLSQLPVECQDIQIRPRCKVALEHRTTEGDVWVVLLTRMPNQPSRAWKLSKGEYYRLMPKHGTRDRYIRENMQPTIESKPFNVVPKQDSLF